MQIVSAWNQAVLKIHTDIVYFRKIFRMDKVAGTGLEVVLESPLLGTLIGLYVFKPSPKGIQHLIIAKKMFSANALLFIGIEINLKHNKCVCVLCNAF